MGRRDSNDEKWIEVKDRLHKRDKSRCRLSRIISAKDALILRHRAGSRIGKIDAAHIFPVSTHPWMVYELNDLVCLNRYSHEMLDTCRDPITGASITHEEVYEWWEKIAGVRQWTALTNMIQHRLGVNHEHRPSTEEVS